jgi:A/G-specific adenine glycosylase
MCQQTQIATVLPYYARWLQAFPDWRALAAAADGVVLKHWEGLGYYHRARNLHRLAQAVVSHHGGQLPATSGALRQLPGIGPYTAAAIASICHGERAAVLDGNVERVLTRAFALPWNVARPAARERLRRLAGLLLPRRRCGDHNQAMMELGAIVCTPCQPHCLLCPLAAICRAKANPEAFPNKTRTPVTKETQTVAVITSGGKIWLLNPGQPGRWRQFHRLPLLDEATMRAGATLAVVRYSITRYRVTASAVRAAFKGTPPATGAWLEPARLAQIPLPAPHRKILTNYSLLSSMESKSQVLNQPGNTIPLS